MNAGREQLFCRFDELGIEAPTVAYPSHRTVEEGKALRGDMRGTFTKNLLLKDKKGRLYLVSAVQKVIRNGLTLLGVSAPEKM